MSSEDDDRTVFGMQMPKPAVRDPLPAPAARDAEDKTVLALRRALPEEKSAAKRQARAVDADVDLMVQQRRVGKPSNPLLAAATDVLSTLGLLRMGRMDLPTDTLRDQLRAALLRFQDQCAAAKLSKRVTEDGLYALCATCDDLAQTLPGADPEVWRTEGLTAEFFDDPNPGIGFFTRLHRVSGHPRKNANLLDLMLTCLSLGFEGQYRATPEGALALSRLRIDLYEKVKVALPPLSAALSPTWKPVVLRGTRPRYRTPMWLITGVAAAMVVALYSVLAWTLTEDAQAAQTALIDLHDPNTPLAIERVALPAAVPAPVLETYSAPAPARIDRLRTALSAEIAAGDIRVAEEGDFLVARLGAALEFGAGAANLTSEAPIIARVAALLEDEPGAIIIEGHSDNIPLSGRGRYKTNAALSEARAAAVRDVLAGYLTDPARMRVVGVGAAKPLDRANTAAARARNRRVDILLRKADPS